MDMASNRYWSHLGVNSNNHFYWANAKHEYTLNTWRSIFEPSVKAYRVKCPAKKDIFSHVVYSGTL